MSDKLLFVCGFPGGGTDLTKNILNAHPEIYLNGEMPFLPNLTKFGYGPETRLSNLEEIENFKNLLRKLNTWGNIENLDCDFTEALKSSKELSIEEILRVCYSDKRKTIWGNKTPQNTENITKLVQLFPNAYFLITVRDVRDICLSWNNKWGKDILWCSEKWATRMQLGWNAIQEIDPNHVHIVYYENVLTDIHQCISDMCNFLGLRVSERMLEHQKYTNDYVDGKINYGREILPDNLEKWRTQLSPRTVQRIEEIAYEGLDLYNYQVEFATHPKALTFKERLLGFLHDSMAIILIGNRAKLENSFMERIKNIYFELRKKVNK